MGETPLNSIERARRADAVVDDVARRRFAGEAVDDLDVLDTHPELQPELSEKLAILREAAQTRLDTLELGSSATALPAPTIAPPMIAPGAFPGYDVKSVLGRGGQGAVYRATQVATKRDVAIKTLHEGAHASVAARRRFEREIEIAASLDHPHIVSVFHTGQTADGKPYFVMDYVPGEPLQAFVRSKKLDLRATLVLFGAVCDAVQHAHQRGVIHRDLKPSNILVATEGSPRVLDFGLARPMVDEERTLISQTDEVVGTLPYMSPEQVGSNPNDLDIRTDVYSLGVVLYELLTGEHPYPVRGSLLDALKHITETEAVSPRLRWSQERGIATDGAGIPRRANNPIDHEVETIVLKSLQKDRERRYQSAGELARELERYLNGEPIEAKADSFGYVLRKQLVRHRLPVAAALAFLLLLIGGLATSLTFWARAEHAREFAQQQQAAAERSAKRAQLEARRLGQVNRFFADMLSAVDPRRALRRDISVREMVDRAAKSIEDGALEGAPMVEAIVRETIGRTYYGLGIYANAADHLKRARELLLAAEEPEPGRIVDVLVHLASIDQQRGAFDAAESTLREALDWLERADTTASDHVANKSAVTLRHNLATLLSRRARPDLAEPLLRSVLAQRLASPAPDEREIANSLNSLAACLLDQGETEESLALLEEALAIRQSALATDHPDLLRTQWNIAFVHLERGNVALARDLARSVLDRQSDRLPSNHPDRAIVLSLCGRVEMAAGAAASAEPFLREALAIREGVFPPDHWVLDYTRSALGECLTELERYADAEPLARAGLRIYQAAAPPIRQREAIHRWLRFCEAADRPDAVGEWPQRLEALEREDPGSKLP